MVFLFYSELYGFLDDCFTFFCIAAMPLASIRLSHLLSLVDHGASARCLQNLFM